MRVVGIDPGVDGAIGLLEDQRFVSVADLPTMQRGPSSKKRMINAAELARIVRDLRGDCAVVELVNAMPPRGDQSGMGAASAFSFGETAGVIRGVVAAIGLECHYVTPQTWKKRAGLSGSDKEASRARAIQLWPIAPLALKKHQGRAEALLIARFGAPSATAPAPMADPFDLHSLPESSAPETLRLV